MSTDISLAFDSLDARAKADAGPNPLDRISLRDYVVEVEIGAFQQERGATQRVRFDIVVEVRPTAGPVHDDVDRILSYDTLTEAIEGELAAERLNLLETLAERIAERVLHSPRAHRIFVRIEKLDIGPGALGVEIMRGPGDAERPVVVGPPVVAPTVAYFGNAALRSGHVAGWIDQLAGLTAPVILCVGAAEGPRPAGGNAAVQNRIDLLAIEQNAWILAGMDPRCVVRGTRTELDWAAQRHELSVWAPSKLVLDAVGTTPPAANNPVDLTLWFCKEIDASALLVFGDEDVATDVEYRRIPPDQPKIRF